VILNDASADELRILRGFQATHPDTFRVECVSRESIGRSASRGLRRASTPYVGILDVDDLRVDDSYERQLAMLDMHRDADFTYGDFVTVPFQGVREGHRVSTPEYDAVEFSRSCVASPTQVFRSGLVARIGGFDEQFMSGGDYEFQIRAALDCSFVRTAGLLLYYTKETDSSSASSSRLQPLERTAIELRYGLYDKTIALGGLAFVEEARAKYRLDRVLMEGEWHPIESFVPEYRALLASREPGLRLLDRRLVNWRRRCAMERRVDHVVPKSMRQSASLALRRIRARLR